MSLSAVFEYRPMAKQAVDCRNMVRVTVWYTVPHHCLVTQKLQSTYFNVLYTYLIIGRKIRIIRCFLNYCICVVVILCYLFGE